MVLTINDNGTLRSFELAQTSDLPTALSDLTNDSGFLNLEVVQSLPTQNISTSTVYLLAENNGTQNAYTEYVRVSNAWEKLGGGASVTLKTWTSADIET